MHDVLTPAEKSLTQENNQSDAVDHIRHLFQKTMEADFREAVERLTGRKVLAFISGNHIDPDIAAEVCHPGRATLTEARSLIHDDGKPHVFINELAEALETGAYSVIRPRWIADPSARCPGRSASAGPLRADRQGTDARALGGDRALACSAKRLLVSVVAARWVEHVGERIAPHLVHSGGRDRTASALKEAAEATSHHVDGPRIL